MTMAGSEASPLQEIERRVQLRAKEISLDMAGDGGRAKLRALISDEVAAWSDAYKRGQRAFDLADPELVAERAYRNIAGYGPLEPLLDDDDVWEMMVGAPPAWGRTQKPRSEPICRYALMCPSAPCSTPLVVQMWCSRGAAGARIASRDIVCMPNAEGGVRRQRCPQPLDQLPGKGGAVPRRHRDLFNIEPVRVGNNGPKACRMPVTLLGDEGDESRWPRRRGELHTSPHAQVLVRIQVQDVEVWLQLILLAHLWVTAVTRIIDHHRILVSSRAR